MNKLRIHDAIMFATVMHRNQLRKGADVPYIMHPMEVMQILTENGCSEDVIIAGILHDTLEDTDATPDDIERMFGKNVLHIVRGETEDKSKTWLERKQATIDHLGHCDMETQLVCCADKLSNLRSILSDMRDHGGRVFDRFSAPSVGHIKWYYAGVACALDKIKDYPMYRQLNELVRVVFDGIE